MLLFVAECEQQGRQSAARLTQRQRNSFHGHTLCHVEQDNLAEWSKALASGASPQGRGFERSSCGLLTKSQMSALMPVLI